MSRPCPQCGVEARTDDRFCGACGASLAGVQGSAGRPSGFCTSCGAPRSASDRFCARCGAAVPEGAAPRAGPTDFFADWDVPPPPDEARTEAISRPGSSDTAILQQVVTSPRPAPSAAPEERAAPAAVPPRPRFPWGASVALAGAIGVVVSALLPWTVGGPDARVFPADVPARALLPFGEGAGGPTLGVVLLVAGVIGALVALLTMVVPAVGFLRRLVGLATMAAPVLFALRLVTTAGVSPGDLPGAIGIGVWVCGAGALVLMVAGRWSRG